MTRDDRDTLEISWLNGFLTATCIMYIIILLFFYFQIAIRKSVLKGRRFLLQYGPKFRLSHNKTMESIHSAIQRVFTRNSEGHWK